MKKKNFIIGTIIVLIITFICCYFISPLINKINFGLDLQGGFEVLYEVEPLNSEDELTNDMLYSTYKAILKRIDVLGVSEPEITIEGDNRIRIKLAGIKNANDARNTISSTAVLSFRDANDNLLLTSDVLGGEARVGQDEYNRPAVSLKIKNTDAFYEATKKVKNMTNNVMVIWLDYDETTDSYRNEQRKAENGRGGCGTSSSHCLSAALVERAFASDVIIQGSFTKEEVTSLVELINSGALPTKLNEISSRTVEAAFGANSLTKTLTAGVIGIICVIILMITFYRFSGFIASFGLVLYTFMTFGIFYLIDGVLTLPGIAAMLLGIGMAVDANVICFERVKEHLLIGKSLSEAYDLGNKSSFTSIIDANVTTIIAAIIMFILGESSVKGFATMLIITIITTIIIMVYLVKFILKLFVKTHIFDDKLGLFIGINKDKIKKDKNIHIPFEKLNIVKHRMKFIGVTLVLLVVGVIIFLTTGANYGVDFSGGTSITIASPKSNTETVVTNLLKDDNYNIEKTSISDKELTIIISEVLEKESITNLTSTLKDEHNLNSDIYVVSKVVKQELVKNAVKSLLIASIGIIIYIAVRFRFNYAISGIVALIHDVLFTFLFFSIFKIQIDSIFIAAILTIIGYSINDTIVTFDIIRETYKSKYKNSIIDPKEIDELVNTSIRRTLTRTILTTITTIIPVIILLFFGSREIVTFNIALLVGFIAGTYSSIFVSNMLWAFLEKKRIMKPKKEDDDDDEVQELKVRGINC